MRQARSIIYLSWRNSPGTFRGSVRMLRTVGGLSVYA